VLPVGSPGDDTEREVEHGEVGVGAFCPAHEQPAEAVEPAVGALGHPAARLEARLAFDRLRLLTPGADVGGVTTLSGIPLPSVIKLRLTPPLPRSVGLGPVFSPPKGALVIAPSTDSQLQSMPLSRSYSSKPSRQNASNTSASSHSRKRR